MNELKLMGILPPRRQQYRIALLKYLNCHRNGGGAP
jgi:hypothetical protein